MREGYLSKSAFILLLLISGNERQLRELKDISSEEIQAEKDVIQTAKGELAA